MDVEAPITVSLGEVYRGTSRTVELPGGRRVEVRVPAGVKEGTVLRVPGLRATVQVAPDPLFSRDGKDVRVVVPVALHVALRGGEVAAPTIKGGKVNFKVPAETQNGTKIRLRGRRSCTRSPRGRGCGSGSSRLSAIRFSSSRSRASRS